MYNIHRGTTPESLLHEKMTLTQELRSAAASRSDVAQFLMFSCPLPEAQFRLRASPPFMRRELANRFALRVSRNLFRFKLTPSRCLLQELAR